MTTLTATTVRLVEPGGRLIPFLLSYDAATDRMTLLPRERLNPGVLYSVRITQGATDLRGNHLAAEYAWTFMIGGVAKQYLFLPAIRR